jgi:uncharacterized protein (TIGR02145 family)
MKTTFRNSTQPTENCFISVPRLPFTVLRCCLLLLATGTGLGLWAQPADEESMRAACRFPRPSVVTTFQQFDAGYSASTYITLTDARDGKEYAVVRIGRHWIMAQNLNYQDSLLWQSHANLPTQRYGGGNTELIGHFWCPGGYGPAIPSSSREGCKLWGALYAWETAMMADGKWGSAWLEPEYSTDKTAGNTNNGGRGVGGHGICPLGWHVPTDAEWGEVFDALEDGAKVHNIEFSYNGATAGYRAKAPCTCPGRYGNLCVHNHSVAWFDLPVADATAEVTLHLLPAGLRSFDGTALEGRGLKAALWSSTAYSLGTAWYRSVRHNSSYVYRYVVSRSYGASVRCIKTT